uniref:Coiled-coil protein 142 C-terminal domain-containing protein n=1 Tax=Clastoptera arizonana TaxID=38151 RepID=A0A1B6E8U2_9HEMI
MSSVKNSYEQNGDKTTEDFIKQSKYLHLLCCEIQKSLSNYLKQDGSNMEELVKVCESLPMISATFVELSQNKTKPSPLFEYSYNHWKTKIWSHRLTILYLINQVVSIDIVKILEYHEENENILILFIFYNELLAISNTTEPPGINMVKNTCSTLLKPLRHMSATKILQILAQQRAEKYSHQLITILLNIYHNSKDLGYPINENLQDDEIDGSDNSSMEIYRTLAGYITPPQCSVIPPIDDTSMSITGSRKIVLSDVAQLDSLILSEEQNLAALLIPISKISPSMLGANATKISKSTGCVQIRKKVQLKINDYYQQILWGEVGTTSEHVLLWWGPEALGLASPQTGHLIKSWLTKFISTVSVPNLVKTALHSLLDSLCSHVTLTSWDELFRKALVSACYQHSRHITQDVGEGTKIGQLFFDVFNDLVLLNNQCEGPNWTLEDLEGLPLVEQIPILHRLDHSVHTVRLWVESRARQLSNYWNMNQFFKVTQNDVNICLHALSQLQLANQTDLLGPDSSVHVMVCCKMRAKLVSEVRVNIEKLQKVANLCIDNTLTTVCRTVSLANLQMVFPDSSYWRQQIDEMPQYVSGYVEDYLDEVLRPVLVSTNTLSMGIQQKVSGLVLCIMCEAWLDHIYIHQIRFSEWGALQLLTDFGAIPTWLIERVTLTSDVRNHLLNTEVLKRCEGVGRLLLRHPGEHISMSAMPPRKKHDSGDGTPRTPENMPAEMYVPNQEQWLQLRAPRHNKTFILCCGNQL